MIKATVRIENSAGPGPCHFVSNLEIFGSNMFHYVSYVSQYEHNGFPAIGAGFPARHTPATYRQFVCDR